MKDSDPFKQSRLDLVLDAPFWGTLAFKLTTSFDKSVETTHVDGRHIKVNPDYYEKLTPAQRNGQFAENIIHCAQKHIFRRGGRDLARWNAAADQASWEIISKLQNATDGRIIMPPNGHCKPKYAGLSTEEIYHVMEQEEQENKQNGQPPPPSYQSGGSFDEPAPDDKGDDDKGDGDGKGDQPQDGDGKGDQPAPPQPAPSLEEEWDSAVQEAAIAEIQRNQGNMPAWLKHLVDEISQPKVPWTDLVREFCHRLSRDDYSFRRPNKRFLRHGIVLPSLYSESLGKIVGAFDTSGSIFCYPKLVASLLSEFQGILDLCKPETMALMSCDTQVHQNVDFYPGDSLLDFHPEGGGGTDFRPVFAAIDELPEPPACLIFLTDLEGRFPDEEPPYPVLWANFGNPRYKAPFGTTIHVPIET